jgi:hypothetical protein
MNQKELFSLLRITVILFIVTITFFIVFVNFFKFIEFVVKIDDVVKSVGDEEEIQPIKNGITVPDDETSDFREDESHTARQLGYADRISELNGSEWGRGVNILIAGSDKKNFQVTKSRADVIILIRIIESGKMMSISIPRDTLIRVDDADYAGNMDKIGHSLYWGGLESLKKNVEELVGSPIDRVVIIDNFRSFEAFLAIIGGIEIDKDLKGKTGIQWIRNRHFKYGDIERCKRQQLFLERSIVKIWKITKGGNYIYTGFFYDALKKIVLTDITKDEFYGLLYNLKKQKFNPERDFYTGVLDGRFSRYDSKLLNLKNLSCWVADRHYIEKLQFLFYSDSNSPIIQDHVKKDFWGFMKLDLDLYFKRK